MAAVTSSAGVFFSTQVQWNVTTSLTSGAELRGPGTVKFGQRKHLVGAVVGCGGVVATAVDGAINFSPPSASTRLQEGLVKCHIALFLFTPNTRIMNIFNFLSSKVLDYPVDWKHLKQLLWSL